MLGDDADALHGVRSGVQRSDRLGKQARPSFTSRYLSGEFDAHFGVPAERPDVGLTRPDVQDAGGLVSALEAQAMRRGDRAAQIDAIRRLGRPGARAVVTGQQAGLLLGPSFSVYKAASAIAHARAWSTDDRPVVPVFWVASQDHDGAEIDHAHVMDRSERWTRLSAPFPTDRAAGRVRWQRDWTIALHEAWSAMDWPSPHGEAAWRLMCTSYESSTSLGDAFARMMSQVFGDHGLIVLDPMEPEIAERFAPILRAEVNDPLAGPDAIRRSADAWKVLGETPQLNRAPGATNLFVEDDRGKRQLARFVDGAFYLDGDPTRRVERSELLARIDHDPASITPAAGLRPITQDALLPTAAVVVGPGELRYFSQLKGVYERHGVPMAAVVPRAGALVIEPPIARILASHDLDPVATASDVEGTFATLAAVRAGHERRIDEASERLHETWTTWMTSVHAIDPSLEGPVNRGRSTLRETLSRVREKVHRAALARDEVLSVHATRVAAHLAPDGGPQERYASPFTYFAKFGVAPFVRRVLELEATGMQVLYVDRPPS